MSTDSNQKSESRSNGDEHKGQSHPAPERVGVIVDPQGQPYANRENPYQKLKKLIKRVIGSIPHGERMMIFLTATVAIATCSQAGVAWYSFHMAGKTQTDQFNQMKSVADRVEGAAKSFAGNSANINQNISQAVTKLGEQSDKLGANVSQSTRIADATRQAFEVDERPYVGFVGVTPTYSEDGTVMTYSASVKNYGKIPAEEFSYDWEGYVDGVKLNKSTVFPATPGRLAPGNIIYRHGIMSGPGLAALRAGKVTFIIYLKWSYRWRDKPLETECAKEQYDSYDQDFAHLGSTCAP